VPRFAPVVGDNLGTMHSMPVVGDNLGTMRSMLTEAFQFLRGRHVTDKVRYRLLSITIGIPWINRHPEM